MKPGKRHGSALSRRFQELMLQLARQARGDLEKVPRHSRRAIHALRTRMKKLAAIIRLVKSHLPEPTRRAMLDSAKRLKKAFAAQRDAQVADEMGFAGATPKTRRTPAPLFDEAARLTSLLTAATLDGLTRDEVREAYIGTYRAGRKRMKACLDDPDPARLHAWRKPVKELYYQSLALHQAPGMARRMRRARRLGRWLGRDHDWQAIIERQPRAAKNIARKRARLRRRIFTLAHKLYAAGPKKLGRKLA